jgi:hypothetical protein
LFGVAFIIRIAVESVLYCRINGAVNDRSQENDRSLQKNISIWEKNVYVPKMKILSLEEIKRLLEAESLPGSRQQLCKLRVRITELAQLNGTQWIHENRMKLRREWQMLINKGLIR